jgi:hypothetical protein
MERDYPNRHYSEKKGHAKRGEYWKEIKQQIRQEQKVRKIFPDIDQFSLPPSPLVGVDVLVYEERK